MSDTTDAAAPGDDGLPRVQIATVYRGSDGRLRLLDVLPDPAAGTAEDPVLIYDTETQRPKWVSPASLGFSAVPVLLDVPVADGSGAVLVDGSGAAIASNVPFSTGA